jgi:flagella basal body P-ring formation protein FlgA
MRATLAPMFRLLLTNSRRAALAMAGAVSLACGSASAQTAASPDLLLYLQTQASGALTASHTQQASQARVEVTLGQLDPRLQLAPCARIEPFVPPGARLWGRAHLGLRCAEGATWSVQMPVTVRVFGPALVAARPLAANTPIGPDDLSPMEVEWTREAQGVVTDIAQLDNRVLSRPLAAGQPLPLAALRAPQVISAGDPVKVMGRGRGFAVTVDAIAMTSAQDGQSVRVRTDAGRIITGTARGGRRVEVVF